MKALLLPVCAILSAGAFAAPQVDEQSVAFEQDSASLKVTVSYALVGPEPAVVTLDIQTNYVSAVGDVSVTNWVSIGAQNIVGACGDVHMLVQPGAEKRIYWHPDSSWPGHVVKTGTRAVVQAWATNAPPAYLVFDLDYKKTRYYDCVEQIPGKITDDEYKTTKLVLRRIPAAGIRMLHGMGGDSAETGWKEAGFHELLHYVTLSDDFYIGVYPITNYQRLYIWNKTKSEAANRMNPCIWFSGKYVRGESEGCRWPTNGHAVGSDSWLALARKLTGLQFDLPTEAQWEFAARAGLKDVIYGPVDEIAWTKENSGYTDNFRNSLHPVGGKKPNGWGLYDLLGGAREMCLDCVGLDYTTGGEYLDPKGPDVDAASLAYNYHMARGGAQNLKTEHCVRSTSRLSCDWDTEYDESAFRVVCPCAAAISNE